MARVIISIKALNSQEAERIVQDLIRNDVAKLGTPDFEYSSIAEEAKDENIENWQEEFERYDFGIYMYKENPLPWNKGTAMEGVEYYETTIIEITKD